MKKQSADSELKNKANARSALRAIGYVGLCKDERLAGNDDDPFVRSACRILWELRNDLGGFVEADYYEIT